MPRTIQINGRLIGPGEPTYVIAEMSANHAGSLEHAVAIVEAAKSAGADAVKLQTYTADTMTIDSDDEPFRIQGTIWNGRTLYDLYEEAYMPWEWQPKLKSVADSLGLDLFSSPFDPTAVDFLEAMGVAAYKIASFEIVDLPLIERVARTGIPVIMSTGMATLAEIDEAVTTFRNADGGPLALLKCASAYPAPAESMHLRSIPHLSEAFDLPVGLSDHSLGSAIALVAVALGACIVEKHFTLSRQDPGPDSSFSLEPTEFKDMVDGIRLAEAALGSAHYGGTDTEAESRAFRRSLFVVRDVAAGELFTIDNVRSIRPGSGLHTRDLAEVLGRRATRDVPRGTPLSWPLVGERRP